MDTKEDTIRLTQFSHGAGCGCKISPSVLSEILKSNEAAPDNARLLVGNHSRDDAAVWDLGNGTALISTTDFFMPVVDDAFDFGRIAAANAISDVYAMGGQPVLAIAILGWPVDKLSPQVAGEVISGGRTMCSDCGIPLAGGHSIDSPEPIFGLAVNGIVEIKNLKKNNTACEGDFLFLTKPIGTGIITTASKKGIASQEDINAAVHTMTTINKIGSDLGKMEGVHALTDVTGFGLIGHVIEMTEGSNVSAELFTSEIPFMANIDFYLDRGCVPGGTKRNWSSYGDKAEIIDSSMIHKLCDPQTSGGLLISVGKEAVEDVMRAMRSHNIPEKLIKPVGRMIQKREKAVYVA